MDDSANSDDELGAAIAAMESGYEAALEVARKASGYEGYVRATRLSEAVAAMQKPPADLRITYAAQVAEQEALSLRGLAKRISVSATRAKQMKDAAQSLQPEDSET